MQIELTRRETCGIRLENLNEKSIEQQVIDLRKEGKTIRQIEDRLHKSSRKVIDILKNNELREIKEELKAKENQRKKVQQTTYTKALKLLSNGNSVLDVTIKLGITSDESKKAYFDFQDLQTTDQFGKVYNQSREYFPVLLPFCKTLKEKGLGIKEANLALEYAMNRSEAEDRLRNLIKLLNLVRTEAEERKDGLLSIIKFARQLPFADSDGMINVQNFSFKLFVTKIVDEFSLDKSSPSKQNYVTLNYLTPSIHDFR